MPFARSHVKADPESKPPDDWAGRVLVSALTGSGLGTDEPVVNWARFRIGTMPALVGQCAYTIAEKVLKERERRIELTARIVSTLTELEQANGWWAVQDIGSRYAAEVDPGCIEALVREDLTDYARALIARIN